MWHRSARILFGTLSTFSIALIALGQESARRPDTLAIPLDFVVNGQTIGDITVQADRAMQDVSIDCSGLKSRLEGINSNELQLILTELPDGFLPILDLQNRGIEISLDLERLVIVLTIEEKKEFDPTDRNVIRLGYQETVFQSERHASEAKVSAYANFDVRLTQSSNEIGLSSDSHKISIDHALNFGGFAIEGDSVWSSAKNGRESRFQINRLRLVKDYHNRMHRISLGDISTPIKDPQRGFQMWGASIVKEFDLQPYGTFTPTSSASFQLDENAVVQMQMNGRPVRSLKLEPGLYDIEQFKLAAGLNTMDLEIVTESGSIERIQVNNYGEPSLLEKGVSTFALSFGFPYTSENDDSFQLVSLPWYERALDRSPLLSGYYQKGLTDQFTANASLQASQQWSRLGAQTTWVNPLGAFNISLGVNSLYSTGDNDTKLKLDWKRDFQGFKLAASTYFSSQGFEKISSDSRIPGGSIKDSFTLRLSKRISQQSSIDLGLLRQANHQGQSEQSANLNFGYKFPSFHTALSIRHSNRESENGLSAYLTLTWNPKEYWRSRTRIGSRSNGRENEASTNLDYSNRSLRNSLNANLNFQASNDGRSIDGRIRMERERFSATFSRMHLYQNINDFQNKGTETSIGSEFAIAFADGAFGLTRRVSDSFAIVTNHQAWRDVELGINPTLGGFEQKTTVSIFKPVLSDLRAYRESQAIIRPIGGETFLEKDEFFFLPSYKRGSKLTIGDEFVYTLRSTLLYWNEQPASYKTIKINGENTPEILTFTNNSGRFVASGLKPGTYCITVNGLKESAEFRISGDNKLEFISQILLSDPQNSQ